MVQCPLEPNFNWFELIRRILKFKITSKMSQWVGPPSQESILYRHFFPRIFKLDILHGVLCTKCWPLSGHVLWPFLPLVVTRAHEPPQKFLALIWWELGASLCWRWLQAVPGAPSDSLSSSDTCFGSKCKVNLSGRAACYCLISSEHF